MEVDRFGVSLIKLSMDTEGTLSTERETLRLRLPTLPQLGQNHRFS